MVRKDALACSTVDRARYSSAKPRTRGGDLLPRRISAFIAVVAATASTTAVLASNGAAAPANTAFKALSGSTAANYKVSADMKLVRKLELGRGTYERYQQVYGGRIRARRTNQHLPQCVRRHTDGHRLALLGNHAAKLGEALEDRGFQEGRQGCRRVREAHRVES